MPKTDFGKWSVKLILSFFVFFGFFWLMILTGQRGGMGFFSNLSLAIPALLSAVSGIGAFLIGMVSIVGFKERSVLVFISTLIGALVTLFVAGEIIFPH
jgi:hypothetical protein